MFFFHFIFKRIFIKVFTTIICHIQAQNLKMNFLFLLLPLLRVVKNDVFIPTPQEIIDQWSKFYNETKTELDSIESVLSKCSGNLFYIFLGSIDSISISFASILMVTMIV